MCAGARVAAASRGRTGRRGCVGLAVGDVHDVDIEVEVEVRHLRTGPAREKSSARPYLFGAWGTGGRVGLFVSGPRSADYR